MSEAKPFPKSAQLARGERRYRREVASPKQWQAIIAAKHGPCRCCGAISWTVTNGGTTYHHLVPRVHGGADTKDNIVPLCEKCHGNITRRSPMFAERLLASLSDAEYSYLVHVGGEDAPERFYGIRYGR